MSFLGLYMSYMLAYIESFTILVIFLKTGLKLVLQI